MQWNSLISLLSFLLLLFLVWKEIKRPNKSRLYLRLIASLLAVASLLCMALTIYIPASLDAVDNKHEAILLTTGYNKDSLRSFIKLNPALPAYEADTIISTVNVANKKLHVFGYGLTKDEWLQLNPSCIIFHPSEKPFGVNSIYWKQQLKTGETLSVQGAFNNSSDDSVKLVLGEFNHSFDSGMLPPHQLKTFELTDVPSHIGKAVYTLSVHSRETVQTEPLPVNVLRSDKLNVLMLAASPDFENKFLSQWLSENDCIVAVRTAISKNKFTQTFLDTAKFKLDQLTTALLDKFDVIIADASELQSISKPELDNINKQVSDKGCGLIIKIDSVAASHSFYNNLFSVTAPDYSKHSISLRLTAIANPVILTEEQPVYIKQQQGTKALITDDKNNVVAGSGLYGSGKVVYTTLSNSYSWVLSGSHQNYNALWSALLTESAQRKSSTEQWRIHPFLPTINQPVDLYINTKEDKPLIYAEESRIALAQDKLLPVEWSGKWWPLNKGWNDLKSLHSNFSTYVFDKHDWQNIALLQGMNETYQYIQGGNKNNVESLPIAKKELSKIYFFILFIISCALLWIEKKFS